MSLSKFAGFFFTVKFLSFTKRSITQENAIIETKKQTNKHWFLFHPVLLYNMRGIVMSVYRKGETRIRTKYHFARLISNEARGRILKRCLTLITDLIAI